MLNSHTIQVDSNKSNVADLQHKTLKVLFVSQKGGVGKSTLSANFAAWNSEK